MLPRYRIVLIKLAFRTGNFRGGGAGGSLGKGFWTVEYREARIVTHLGAELK